MKEKKIYSEEYIPTTCISSKHGDNVCKVLKISVLNCKRSFENIGLKLYEELRTQGTHYPFTKMPEKMTKFKL